MEGATTGKDEPGRSDDAARLYDENYYEHHFGTPYRAGDPGWTAFFGRIADAIVAELSPRTVLDAGCAHGFLVAALRERGVEAWGIDVSEYALEQVPHAVREFCRLQSVTDDLARDYELIVCIEVFEHLGADEAERAAVNVAAHTSSLLFSSTPHDFREPTHRNVRPPEYWAGLFARYGFFRNVDLDASFIAPQAIHFVRRNQTAVAIARDYERWSWQHRHERHELREALFEAERRLSLLREEESALRSRVLTLERDVAELQSRAAGAERSLAAWEEWARRPSVRFLMGLAAVPAQLAGSGSRGRGTLRALVSPRRRSS
jgi:SAM-dependent methyltransferase